MYYVGCHQTDDLNDGYIGSGKHLKRAIKKYGEDNFKFEILYILPTKEEMFKIEKEIVSEEFVKDPLTYNLKIGGSGGNPGIVGAFKGRKHSKETKEKIRNSALKQITTEEKRKKLSNNNWARKNPDAQKEHAIRISKGIPKSSDHKEKLSLIQTGKKLVNNGIKSTWVKEEEVSFLLSQGWKLGRKNNVSQALK
jgi:group I intron endonuclease